MKWMSSGFFTSVATATSVQNDSGSVDMLYLRAVEWIGNGEIHGGTGKKQVPRLRCAPLGMTTHEGFCSMSTEPAFLLLL